MRQRGKDAWELRVYEGIDPDTRRQRWLTRTVHGSERYARRQLKALVTEAGRAWIRAGTLSDLLDQWDRGGVPWLVGLDGQPYALDRRLPPQAAPPPPRPDQAHHRGHRRLLRAPPAGGGSTRPAARLGNRCPRTRRTPPGPRSGRPMGLDMAEPGFERDAATGSAARGAAAEPEPAGRTPRVDEARGSAVSLLSETGGFDRRPSEPAAGPFGGVTSTKSEPQSRSHGR
jgi:hypothetical protein